MTTPEQEADYLIAAVEEESVDADVLAGIADLYRDRRRMDFVEEAFADYEILAEWYLALQDATPSIPLREFVDNLMAGNTAATEERERAEYERLKAKFESPVTAPD